MHRPQLADLHAAEHHRFTARRQRRKRHHALVRFPCHVSHPAGVPAQPLRFFGAGFFADVFLIGFFADAARFSEAFADGFGLAAGFHENLYGRSLSTRQREYASLLKEISKVQSAPAKTIRFLATTAVGVMARPADPMLGLGAEMVASS